MGQNLNSENEELLKELKDNLRDTPPAGPLVNLCKTYDQAKAVAQFIDALAEKQLKYEMLYSVNNVHMIIFVNISDHQHH